MSEEAKKVVKKYNLMSNLCTLPLFFLVGVIFYVTVSNDLIQGLVALAFGMMIAILASRRINGVLVKKYIVPVGETLDFILYREIIVGAKLALPGSPDLAPCDLLCGDYQSPLDVYSSYLKKPKIMKKHGYVVLMDMANCYFNMGNDEMLRDTVDKIAERLANDSEEKRQEFLSSAPRYTFYKNYLDRNVPACCEYANNAGEEIRAHAVFRSFCKARVALLCDDKDSACKYFEYAANEAPNFCYGIASLKALVAIRSGKEYRDAFDQITPAENYRSPKRPAKDTIIMVIQTVLAVALIFYYLWCLGVTLM